MNTKSTWAGKRKIASSGGTEAIKDERFGEMIPQSGVQTLIPVGTSAKSVRNLKIAAQTCGSRPKMGVTYPAVGEMID